MERRGVGAGLHGWGENIFMAIFGIAKRSSRTADTYNIARDIEIQRVCFFELSLTFSTLKPYLLLEFLLSPSRNPTNSPKIKLYRLSRSSFFSKPIGTHSLGGGFNDRS